MRMQAIVACLAVFNLSALGVVSAQTPAAPVASLETLAGVWTAEPFSVGLNSDFDKSVWGPNASSLRKVQLTLQPSGEGTITVTRSVVDGRGRPRPASVSIEQAHLKLHMPTTIEGGRFEPVVDVLSPERHYPDTPTDCWPLTGLSVKLLSLNNDYNRLLLRFDLADGRGSFGETLVRRGAATDKRRHH